jgi:SAM-dependent methyltransferase
MAVEGFDGDAFKASTSEQWQGVAEAWHRWVPVMGERLAPMTELMFEMAQVGTGDHVLDLAAGDGDQSLAAARRVGSDGFVLSTDIASNLVAYAQEAATSGGVHQMRAQVMDAENLELDDGSFDAVISRNGLMFMPHLDRTLAEIRRVLRPGGRVAAIVFSTPDRSPFFSLPVAVIGRRLGLPAPPPGQPGPFSLGREGVLVDALGKAGFVDVRVEAVSAPCRMDSAAQCAQMERETFGALQQMLDGLGQAERDDIWAEIEAELGQFESEDGFESPSEELVGVGVKPQ